MNRDSTTAQNTYLFKTQEQAKDATSYPLRAENYKREFLPGLYQFCKFDICQYKTNLSGTLFYVAILGIQSIIHL